VNKFRAAGVLFRTPDRYYLLAQRGRNGTRPFKWGLPGGGVEVGEDPQDSAVREVIEELGSMPPEFEWSGLVFVRPTPSRHGLFYSYVYDVPSSTIEDWKIDIGPNNPFGHETAQVRWLTAADIEQLKRLDQLVGEIILPG